MDCIRDPLVSLPLVGCVPCFAIPAAGLFGATVVVAFALHGQKERTVCAPSFDKKKKKKMTKNIFSFILSLASFFSNSLV